jgi:hypothetical protein
LQTNFAKPYIEEKQSFINTASNDPRLMIIREYLLKVQHLSFEARPDFADLSNIVSRAHYPVIKYIDDYLRARALKELASLAIKEAVNKKVKIFAHYKLARRIVGTKLRNMIF